MADYIWKTGYCEYTKEGLSGGQVKVTTLHWNCTLIDKDFSANEYGSVDASDQNRVYTLPALKAVPESVMNDWVKDALGAEEVAAIENRLQDSIYEQENPTTGGFDPSETDPEILTA